MICPKCHSNRIGVTNSRPSNEGNGIRRRRECTNCHYRFTTYEHTRAEIIEIARQILETEIRESIGTAVDNSLKEVFDKNKGKNTSPYHEREGFVI